MVNGPVSFSGLVSGLNTQSIISAEMAVYEQPLTNLQTEQSTINTQITDYQAINTQLLSLQQAADALADPAAFNEAYAAASSNSSIATASVSSGTQTGSLTFAVDQLAVGSTQISAGTVASPNDIVTSGTVLIGSGGAALGITSMDAGAGLATGNHTIAVTQSSSGATVSGATAVAASTTIGTSNDQLDVQIDGAAQSFTLAAGTYTPTQLAQAVEQASGGGLSASVSASGELSVATAEQGSAASLQITGGSALSALGLSAGSTVAGTDGVVAVDGTSTTVSDIAGSGTTSVVLNSGTGGTVTLGITGGLERGVHDGGQHLRRRGLPEFGRLGHQQCRCRCDGQRTPGGVQQLCPRAHVQRNGNGFVHHDGRPGVRRLRARDPSHDHGSPERRGVSGRHGGISGDVPVQRALGPPARHHHQPRLGELSTGDHHRVSRRLECGRRRPNPGECRQPTALDHFDGHGLQHADQDGGPPQRGSVAQRLGPTGARRGRRGRGEFGRRFRRDGGGVRRLGHHEPRDGDLQSDGVRGGLCEEPVCRPGDVHRGRDLRGGSAGLRRPGLRGRGQRQHVPRQLRGLPQPVGATGGGHRLLDLALANSALPQAETYTVTGGSANATYAASAGETIADVVNGMNSALAAAGIDASAAIVGSAGAYQLQLASAAYGSAATFQVAASGSDQLGLTSGGSTYTGTDVAGTINGLAAVGSGQFLSSLNSGDPSNGLVLQVSTPGVASATALGTVAYAPGFGQGLAHIATSALLAPNGIIPVTIAGLQGTLAQVGSEISMQQQLVATQQAALTAEFTNMETTLSHLQSESSFLNQAFGGSSSSGSSASSVAANSGGTNSTSGG